MAGLLSSLNAQPQTTSSIVNQPGATTGASQHPHGLLARAYGLLDPMLPFDKTLDPMFGAQQDGSAATPQGASPHHINPLRVADRFLGIGFFPALDGERQRGHEMDLRDQISQIGKSTPDKRAALDQMGAVIDRAEAQGADVSAYRAGLAQARAKLDQQDYFNSLPQSDRLEARVDPGGYMTEHRARTRPLYENVNGVGVVRIDPNAPMDSSVPGGANTAYPGLRVDTLVSAPGKPENLSMDDERARVIREARLNGVDSLNPVDRKLYEDTFYHPDSTNPLSTDRVTAAALDKWVRGEPLSPNEQSLVDLYKQRAQSGGLLGMLLGGGIPGLGAYPGGSPPSVGGAQPPVSPAQPPKQGGNGRSAASPARPQTQADFDKLPVNAWFVNPSDGRVLQKAH